MHKNKNTITPENLSAYREYLRSEEKAAATVEKYGRDVRAFASWLDGEEATKQASLDYKQYLLEEQRREAAGVNAVIAGLNSFFSFMPHSMKAKKELSPAMTALTPVASRRWSSSRYCL